MPREKKRGTLILPTPWTRLERTLLIMLVAEVLVLISMPAWAQVDPRVQLGLVPADVMEGSRLFFNERFGGNGRTCGTCHPAEDNFTLDPADVRRIAATDPLFAPTVPGLERLDLLRSNALILENTDGFAKPPTFRSTSHTLSLRTSITSRVDVPAGTDTVGWDGLGAHGTARTLRDFASGAVRQHFTKSLLRRPGTDFRLPTPSEEAALLAFQLNLGRLADIDLEDVRLSDPAAERGRILFEDDGKATNVNCERCHDQAGANRLDGSGNQNKDTGVDDLRVAGLPHDDGRGSPGDETFSPPPLIEAADTAPFFHTHTVNTLEAAVMFYTTANFTGQRQTFTAQQGADMAAMLRALNVSLNVQMAIQRIEAAQRVEAAFSGHPVAAHLIDLAVEEIADGIGVMSAMAGMDMPRVDLIHCGNFAQQAARHPEAFQRVRKMAEARNACAQANAEIGTGLTMVLGAGNLAP